MIIGEILGVDRVATYLGRMPEKSRQAVGQKVRFLALMLQNYVKEDELTGQALHVRSGNLRRSITNKVIDSDGTYTGIVGTNCVYAAIHEFGGSTRPHLILPVHAKALMFQSAGFVGPVQVLKNQNGRYSKGAKAKITAALAEGALQFAKGVHHPGSKIPMHSFLRSALDAKRSEIVAQLQDAIRGATK